MPSRFELSPGRRRRRTSVPSRQPRPSRPMRWLRLRRLAALAILAAGIAGVGQALASTRCQQPPGTKATVVVGPGDTLWSIAARQAPDIDPRYGVYLLRCLNGLDSAVLSIGQKLLLPPDWARTR